MDIHPAGLVQALAGRDKGKLFVIYQVVDENYVLLCDGKGRSIEKPKKKKIKHIKFLDYSLERIKEKLDSGNKISNSDIRKSIKSAIADLGIDA